jgi:hypothetical protein
MSECPNCGSVIEIYDTTGVYECDCRFYSKLYSADGSVMWKIDDKIGDNV